ncbi:MAG: NFACT family protein [Bacilli bacterium]|nr:NFACT family protein [Bacilli bacterium]
MAFDGLVFRRITTLVSKEVTNARIERIGALSSTDFAFELYNDGKRETLLLSMNPTASFFTIIPSEQRNYLPNEHFINLLHTHIEGGVIRSFKQCNLDRILEIEVSKRNDIGDFIPKKLYLEFLGRMTNLILVKEDGKIIDALHRMGPNEATKRTLYAGAEYRIPPLKEMQDPLSATYNPNLTYSTQFYGVSTLLEAEWNNEKYGTPEIHDFVQQLLNSTNIYIGTIKNKKEFHLMPLHLFKGEYKTERWNQGIYNFYQGQLQDQQRNESSSELIPLIKKDLTKASKKQTNLLQDYENALKAPEYQKYADLLYTYADLEKTGLKSITIEGITIPLNPALSVSKNATKYYDKYHKGKNAIIAIQEQIDIVKQLIEYFELLEIQVTDSDPKSLLEIKQELAEQGYLKKQAKPVKNKQKKTYNVMEFTSPDGISIHVGRNNIQNDYLTFGLANYDEYFFHVKDFPGAHVIVHSNKPLSEATIRSAANLAAYYSKARFSSTVPVNYTQVKNIKKPKGYKFGQVILKSYKTIYIDPINADKH